MWGTSSPDDKLVSDLAKAAESTKIAARRSDRLMAGKLSLPNFGLLQQYLPQPDPCSAANDAHGLAYSVNVVGAGNSGFSSHARSKRSVPLLVMDWLDRCDTEIHAGRSVLTDGQCGFDNLLSKQWLFCSR
jgi:hypothetical protein